MAFRKIEAGLVHADVDQFIGKIGTIFYDNSLGDFRISDGSTPGGIALSFGGGEGGTYTLPTATTSVKGGVKIDGSTIVIANQVISVGTVPYSSLSGTPTIPTNNNQLSNGAAYITSSALTGLATETYVTTRGYITTSALTDYALTSAVPTNNNQLTNGAAYITSAALSGLASETYVTTRGYLTTVAYADVTNKPTLFSGSYVDLTNKPTIPTDINQLTDASGLLGQGGGGGGTTYITNTVENPYSFSIAGDDSTLREIASGESIKITGAGGITVTTDTEGNVTITGPNLSSYATETYVTTQGYITSSALTGLATESYVTSRGYITGLSWNQLTDKPNLAGTYSWSIAGDDSTLREISAGESVKFVGASGITTSSDDEGKITITGPDLSNYVTLTGEQTLTNKTLTSPTITDGVFQDTFSIGNQIFYEHGYNGFSVNEDFDIVGESNFTGYHYTSGAGRDGVAFTLARTGQFTTGFGIHGTSSANEYVIGSETANTDFVFKSSIGMPFDVSGGVEIFRISNTGVLTVVQNENTETVATESFVTGQGYITTTALTGLATETFVTTQGYITGLSWNQLTDKPNLAGTYSWSIAADDSTQVEISAGNLVKIVGTNGITTTSTADGLITISGVTQDRLTSNARSAVLNSNGTFSLPTLTSAPSTPQAGQMALADGVSWDPIAQNNGVPYMIIYTGTAWVGMGGVTMDQVYMAVLELGSAG